VRTIDELLRDVPVFDGLSDDRLRLIAGCSQNVGFDEDAVIARQGAAADVFFVVRNGTVALETFVPARGPVTIETLGPGEVVGWSWLFAPHLWQFDVRAVTPVRATVFDGACLRGKCDADPVLGYDLMSRFARVMIERLQWTRHRLLDVYGHGGAR